MFDIVIMLRKVVITLTSCMINMSYIFSHKTWDDEEDVEWTAPTIPNMRTRVHGRKGLCTCIFKAEIHVNRKKCFHKNVFPWQKIKSPNYTCKWKAPMVDNPGFYTFNFEVLWPFKSWHNILVFKPMTTIFRWVIV